MRKSKEHEGVRATLSCLHRYTGLHICAVPCDGIDDMCLDYEDEDNCKTPNFIYLMMHVSIATLLTTIGSLAVIMIGRRITMKDQIFKEGPNISIPLQFIGWNVEEQQINDLIYTGYFEEAVQNFVDYIVHTVDNINIQKEICVNLTKKIAKVQRAETDPNVFFMRILGTNASIGQLHDLVEESISVKIQIYLWQTLPSRIHSLRRSHHMRIATIALRNFFHITIYYTDIYKDIYIALIIYNQVIIQPSGFVFEGKGSFPTIMLLVIVASIAVTELNNLFIFINHSKLKEWSMKTIISSAMGLPLLPAFISFKKLRQELKLLTLASKIKLKDNILWGWHSEATMTKIRSNIIQLDTLLSEMRANENSFEHFVQFLVLLIILQGSKTSTPIVFGFNKVFLDETYSLVYISAMVSLASLVFGHINYLSSTKNGFVGVTGVIILIPYYSLGSLTQIFRIIVIFTPFLGLFDTMHHYLKGNLLMDNISIMYEPLLNVTYTQLWSNKYYLNEFVEFFSMPFSCCMLILIGVFGIHLLTSYILLLPLNKKSTDGHLRQIMQGTLTLINIPLFCDWEKILRDSDFSIPVAESWNKSKILYAKFQLLFLVQHMLSLAPMIWFKIDVDKRNAILKEGPFKPIPDEDLSTSQVDLLLTLGFMLPFVAAPLQALFAYLYFRLGHPWARVLNSQVSTPTFSSLTEYFNIVENFIGK